MGIIEKINYTLSCERCAVSETVSLLEISTGWEGSEWKDRKDFTNFTAQWKGGGIDVPKIVSAACNACGGVATSESKFGEL